MDDLGKEHLLQHNEHSIDDQNYVEIPILESSDLTIKSAKIKLNNNLNHVYNTSIKRGRKKQNNNYIQNQHQVGIPILGSNNSAIDTEKIKQEQNDHFNQSHDNFISTHHNFPNDITTSLNQNHHSLQNFPMIKHENLKNNFVDYPHNFDLDYFNELNLGDLSINEGQQISEMHPNNNNFVNPYNNQIHGYYNQQQQIQNQLPQKHQNLTNLSGLHYQNQFDHSQHQIGETSNGAYVQQQNQLDLPHSHMPYNQFHPDILHHGYDYTNADLQYLFGQQNVIGDNSTGVFGELYDEFHNIHLQPENKNYVHDYHNTLLDNQINGFELHGASGQSNNIQYKANGSSTTFYAQKGI
uniref:Uncharacterized protein n=1 Tax=Meloidogyne enterolobii TaxID=390850 RepID=A0A6V7WBQ3_MELEN|nr:unnamed protein product [Meloidogyne enterolobii]